MSLAVQAQNFTLAGSGVTNSATSIILKSFKLPDGTTNIVMANFGPTGYGTLEPGTTKEESIKFTGVTQNANGTATLTGVTRGLAFVSPFAETTANKFSHAGGAIFIISNTSAYESELVDAANNQIVGGVKTFTSIPVLPASSPTTDNQATRKKYVDDGLALKMALAGTETVTGQKTFPSADATRARVASDTDTSVAEAFVTLGQLSRQAIAGAANASTTVKGIVEEATDAEVTAGTATGATGARLFVNPASIATTLATITSKLRFGGTGVDGALTYSSGVNNIDLGGVQIFVKNFTSISITGTAKVTFTNPHANGTIVIFKSQGAVTLTSSQAPMIDLSGCGGDVTTNGFAQFFATNKGSSGTAGIGNTFLPSLYFKNIPLFTGSGGGTYPAGGAGGRGGGGLYIECAGLLNFTTTGGISVAGKVGTAHANYGGGGGAGGSCIILYNALTAKTGTILSNGGNGGVGNTSVVGVGGNANTGGSGSGGNGGGNGAGGGGASGYGTEDGTAGISFAGGGGASGYQLVTLNTEFV